MMSDTSTLNRPRTCRCRCAGCGAGTSVLGSCACFFFVSGRRGGGVSRVCVCDVTGRGGRGWMERSEREELAARGGGA